MGRGICRGLWLGVVTVVPVYVVVLFFGLPPSGLWAVGIGVGAGYAAGLWDAAADREGGA
jgi:hypothetical protein